MDGGVQLGINKHCEHYCVLTEKMFEKTINQSVIPECVSFIPENVTKVFSCHPCRHKRLDKLIKGVENKDFTSYEKGKMTITIIQVVLYLIIQKYFICNYAYI